MPERFQLQLSDDDVPLLDLVADDTVLYSSEIGYNSVPYVIFAPVHRADIDQWCDVLARTARRCRLERISETGDSEEVRISGSPNWLS